jgi:hypothetical protein
LTLSVTEPKPEPFMPKDENGRMKPKGAALGFDADLWRAAHALLDNMDGPEY